jgi:drug/metabolite transporter (DMT)-like permease
VGLVGVIVMLRPSASSLVTLGARAAFVSATAYALSVIMLRLITRTDTTTSVIVWTVGLMTLMTGLIAVPDWVPLAREHWKWLIALGVFGAIGQHLLTEAFRAAPPSVVAPFEYTALLWGILIDWTVWHVLPATRVYVGGGIVIASGLYLIWHERSQQGAFDKSCASPSAP